MSEEDSAVWNLESAAGILLYFWNSEAGINNCKWTAAGSNLTLKGLGHPAQHVNCHPEI